MLLRKQGVNKEIKKEIKKYLETNDKTQLYKIDGTMQKQFLEGMAVHSSILTWRIPRTKEPGRLQLIEWQSQT